MESRMLLAAQAALHDGLELRSNKGQLNTQNRYVSTAISSTTRVVRYGLNRLGLTALGTKKRTKQSLGRKQEARYCTKAGQYQASQESVIPGQPRLMTTNKIEYHVSLPLPRRPGAAHDVVF